MIKLVAFDWNGTLISDTQPCVKAENIALGKVGLKPITVKRFQETFEIPITKYFKNLGMDEKFVKKHLWTIEYAFHDNYEKLVNTARSRSGTRELLTWLHKNKILSAIYSNHNIPNIQRHLERWKITHQIDTVLARHHEDHSQVFQRSKDKKLFDYIKSKKIKPSEVVSIGDSEEEIEIANQYGYYSVAITGGYNSEKRLKKHKPNFLIHNLKEIISIIKKLNH